MDQKGKTDKELVEDSDIGVRGLGASVEMMRRLKDSIEKLNDSTTHWSKVLTALTIILFAVANVQIVVSILLVDRTWRGGATAVVAVLVIWFLAWRVFRAFGIGKK